MITSTGTIPGDYVNVVNKVLNKVLVFLRICEFFYATNEFSI